MVDAGSKLSYEEIIRVPPGGYTHIGTKELSISYLWGCRSND